MAIWSAPVSPRTIGTEVERARRCGAAMSSQRWRLSLFARDRLAPAIAQAIDTGDRLNIVRAGRSRDDALSAPGLGVVAQVVALLKHPLTMVGRGSKLILGIRRFMSEP
jgi:hypothetical protein